jgi:hypothetical protein
VGTNYYAKFKVCCKCGRSEQLHLGKSSAGWTFLLQANHFEYYKTWPEMKRWLKDKVIENEYGDPVSRADFVRQVEGKQKNPELWKHGKNDSQNIPADFAKEDPYGFEFHDGAFC